MKNIHLSLMMVTTFMGISLLGNSQTTQEFKDRRKEVTGSMVPGSAMILRTGDPDARFDVSRRGGYFYYLSGIDEPGCTLVLLSDDLVSGPGAVSSSNEILFIRPVNSDRINWDAQTIGIEGAKNRYGMASAEPASSAQEFIGRLLASPLKTIYMAVEKSSSVNAPLSGDEQLLNRAREHGATFTVISPSTILTPMLSLKSPAEISLTRKAVEVTAEAQREAMRSLKPGMYEYQLEAVISYIFRVNGSQSLSFPTIVGSGINSVILHWMENSRKMEAGDLVVVDCGAEKDMYCADITRTYPVSGKYTDRQKAIYEIVLKANEESINMVAPGVKMADVSHRADEVIAEGLVRIGLIKDKSEFKKYYYHGLSHHIGLKDATSGVGQVLEAGMIITIEPGIYVREEKTGVRIEDDVLVTPTGYDVLSKNAPKQIPEIEKMMKEEGLNVFRNVLTQN